MALRPWEQATRTISNTSTGAFSIDKPWERATKRISEDNSIDKPWERATKRISEDNSSIAISNAQAREKARKQNEIVSAARKKQLKETADRLKRETTAKSLSDTGFKSPFERGDTTTPSGPTPVEKMISKLPKGVPVRNYAKLTAPTNNFSANPVYDKTKIDFNSQREKDKIETKQLANDWETIKNMNYTFNGPPKEPSFFRKAFLTMAGAGDKISGNSNSSAQYMYNILSKALPAGDLFNVSTKLMDKVKPLTDGNTREDLMFNALERNRIVMNNAYKSIKTEREIGSTAAERLVMDTFEALIVMLPSYLMSLVNPAMAVQTTQSLMALQLPKYTQNALGIVNELKEMIPFGAQTVGAYYNDGLESDMGNEKAMNYAFVMGLAEMMTERIPFQMNMKLMKGTTLKAGIKKGVSNAYKVWGFETAEAIVGNAIQEGAMEPIQALSKSLFSTGKIPQKGFGEGGMIDFEQILMSAAGGALLGAFASGAGLLDVTTYVKEKKYQDKEQVKQLAMGLKEVLGTQEGQIKLAEFQREYDAEQAEMKANAEMAARKPKVIEATQPIETAQPIQPTVTPSVVAQEGTTGTQVNTADNSIADKADTLGASVTNQFSITDKSGNKSTFSISTNENDATVVSEDAGFANYKTIITVNGNGVSYQETTTAAGTNEGVKSYSTLNADGDFVPSEDINLLSGNKTEAKYIPKTTQEANEIEQLLIDRASTVDSTIKNEITEKIKDIVIGNTTSAETTQTIDESQTIANTDGLVTPVVATTTEPTVTYGVVTDSEPYSEMLMAAYEESILPVFDGSKPAGDVSVDDRTDEEGAAFFEKVKKDIIEQAKTNGLSTLVTKNDRTETIYVYNKKLGDKILKNYGIRKTTRAFLKEGDETVFTGNEKLAVDEMYQTVVLPEGDHIGDRQFNTIGEKRDVKAYRYTKPEIIPYIQEEATMALVEARQVVKGEKQYIPDTAVKIKTPSNEGVKSNDTNKSSTAGGMAWTGYKGHASETIKNIKEKTDMSYAEIEEVLRAIATGQNEKVINSAAGKKIEMILHDNLMYGVERDQTLFPSSDAQQEPNAEYVQIIENINAELEQREAVDIANQERDAELSNYMEDGLGSLVEDGIEDVKKNLDDIKREIVKATNGNVTKEQASGIIYLIDSMANYMNISAEEYINKYIEGINKTDLKRFLKEQNIKSDGIIKGATEFDTETKRGIVHAFESADVTTMVHEFAHIFRQGLRGEDLATAEEFAGVKDGKWTVAAEERFANGYVEYLRTRTPKSGKVRALFDKFKQWLVDIYSKVDADYKRTLTPDVMILFDAMTSGRNESIEISEIDYVEASKETLEYIQDVLREYDLGSTDDVLRAIDATILSRFAFEDKYPGQNYRDSKGLLNKIPDVERQSLISTMVLFSKYKQGGYDNYENIKDMWFGNKDILKYRNSLEAARIQERIKESVGEKSYGKKSKMVDSAIQIYVDLKETTKNIDRAKQMIAKYYDLLTDEQKRIVDLSQTLTQEQIEIAEDIITINLKMGLEAYGNDIITNIRENYIARFWQNKRSDAERTGRFITKTSHAKQRVFESILEGWANGYVLSLKGATNATNAMKDIIAETIENKRLLETSLKLDNPNDPGRKLFSYFRHEGYTAIEHPQFKKWERSSNLKDIFELRAAVTEKLSVGDRVKIGSTGKYGTVVSGDNDLVNVRSQGKVTEQAPDNLSKVVYAGQNYIVSDEGIIFENKTIYAPEAVAKNLNNILGTSSWNKYDAVRFVTKYNALIKSTILQTSFFHHFAFMNSYWYGTHGLGIKNLNPIAAYRMGNRMIKAQAADVELLIRNGFTIGRIQDWEESVFKQEDTRFDAILAKVPGAAHIKEMVGDLRKRQADFLFNKFGAGLKMMSALKNLEFATKKFPNMEINERAKMVAKLSNDDFGGLHHGRMGRDPTVQHFLRLMLLAPDWTESNVRTTIGTIAQLDKKGDPNSAKEMKTLYQKFYVGVAIKGMLAYILGSLALAGIDDDYTFAERFKMAWEKGNLRFLDWDVTPIYKALGYKGDERKYFAFLGHFKDPIKFVADLSTSAKNKGSIFARLALDYFTGTDWKGAQFTTISELFKGEGITKFGTSGPVSYEQLPSFLLYTMRSWLPVQAQNAVAVMLGEMEAIDAITTGAGLRTATTYSNASDKLYGKNYYTEKFEDTRSKLKKEATENEEKGIVDEDLNDRIEILDEQAVEINKLKAKIREYRDGERGSNNSEEQNMVAVDKLKQEIAELSEEGIKKID
jgi:hypothetical protein